MRTGLISLWMCVFMLTACNKISSRKELDMIRELEQMAKDNRESANRGKGSLDMDLMRRLGESYVHFADTYKEARETPEFLFRAGELYSNELDDIPKAITLFQRNYTDYPDHETAANALFFTGYLYNNSLHDLIEAEQVYKAFLAKYPHHSLAPSAQVELSTLGLSDEEVFDKIIGKESGRQHMDSVRIAP